MGLALVGLAVVSILSFQNPGWPDWVDETALSILTGAVCFLMLWFVVLQRQRDRIRYERSRAESVFQASPDAIIIGTDRGTIESLNPAAVRMLGWTPEEVVGRPFDVFLAATDGDEPRNDFQLDMEDPEARFPESLGEVVSVRKDGTVFVSEVSVNVFRDQDGLKTVTIVRDVTERRQLQEARAAEEHRFRQLIEHSSEIIGLIGLDQTVQYASPAFERVLGHAASEWLGRRFTELVVPEDSKQALDVFSIVLASPGAAIPWQLRTRHADGGHRHLEGRATCLQGSHGLSGIVVNAHDVTDRFLAESRLLQLSRAVEQSPVSIVITDLQGRIEYVNPKFCALTGYTAREMFGQNPRLLQSGETPPESYRELWITLSSGREWRGEFHNRKKNGERYWESASVSPIFDYRGKMTHYVAVKEDITERKRTERALRESEERFASAFSNAPIGMALVSPEGLLLRVNEALCRLIGYSEDQLLSLDALAITHPDDRELQRENARQVLAGEIESYSMEKRLFHRCGEEIWIQLHAFLVRDGAGRALHFIHQLQDVTSRKMSERMLTTWAQELVATNQELKRERDERAKVEAELRLAQKLEAIGQLAAGIAHEINTPIQYVGDSAHFLQSSCNAVLQALNAYDDAAATLKEAPGQEATVAKLERVREDADLDFVRAEIPAAFGRVFDGIRRVSTIVKAMKEFAHPSQHDVAAADLNHMLQTTLTVARNEYKHVAELATDFGELPFVPCNVGELNQVFLNLIVNAAHAIGEANAGTDRLGRIEVRTSLEGADAVIRIADTGGGIPDAIRNRVFDPFFTTKPPGKGTGQGLAIARTIVVERHHGSIDFQSRPGEGTTFTIRIPTNTQPEQREVAA